MFSQRNGSLIDKNLNYGASQFHTQSDFFKTQVTMMRVKEQVKAKEARTKALL